MNYTIEYNVLLERIKLDIRLKVEEIGTDSEVGFKTIKIKNSDYQFDMADGFLTEVGEDYLFNKYGHNYNYQCIEFEDLCSLADYIKKLKK
jgi:hypothetical protein